MDKDVRCIYGSVRDILYLTILLIIYQLIEDKWRKYMSVN